MNVMLEVLFPPGIYQRESTGVARRSTAASRQYRQCRTAPDDDLHALLVAELFIWYACDCRIPRSCSRFSTPLPSPENNYSSVETRAKTAALWTFFSFVTLAVIRRDERVGHFLGSPAFVIVFLRAIVWLGVQFFFSFFYSWFKGIS